MTPIAPVMDAASMASLIAHSDLFGRMLETSLDDARVASGSVFRPKRPTFFEVSTQTVQCT